jgi:hypothetical protein
LRAILLIVGFLLLAGGLYLGYQGSRAIYLLNEGGGLSLAVWTNEFWLSDPDNYRRGLGPNGRWAVRLFGAFWLLVFGWALVKASGWMVKR